MSLLVWKKLFASIKSQENGGMLRIFHLVEIMWRSDGREISLVDFLSVLNQSSRCNPSLIISTLPLCLIPGI